MDEESIPKFEYEERMMATLHIQQYSQKSRNHMMTSVKRFVFIN
jgi:hypothetical protein